ncbi:hypothetical protein TrCOL_g8311 [Triparma columacea]|uniref:Alpha/beta-hydrolase n=1 Tax=Triparma columacea TaxID=722753 RepID=A0A9W7GG66_9STRA|nr:hypothetical protein TrCOL_g8311 [Triparma columacea]
MIADGAVLFASPFILTSQGLKGWCYFKSAHFSPSKFQVINYMSDLPGDRRRNRIYASKCHYMSDLPGDRRRNRIYASKCPLPAPSPSSSKPFYLFVHGGAWGTGHPLFYKTFCLVLNERGYDAGVIGYNLGPFNSATGQAEELEMGIRSLREMGRDVVVVGHSSGAHVGIIASLMSRYCWKGTEEGWGRVKGFVGLSGVYDIPMHYDYEARRGLEQLSPMQPANGWTRLGMRRNAVKEIWDGIIARGGKGEGRFDIVLVHGMVDTTVPFTQSKILGDYARGMDIGGGKVTEVYGDWDHQDPALMFCFGGEGVEVVMEVMEGRRREEVIVVGSKM